MFMRLRMLRNQEGASPGSGAATPAPSTTTSQAQGAGQQGNDLASQLAQFRNSVFADMRKMVEGIVDQRTAPKGDGKQETQPPAQKPGEQRSGGMTADEVNNLIARRDAFADAIAGYPDKARSFLRERFAKENPENVADWVKGYTEAFDLRGGAAPAGAAGGANQSTNTSSHQGPPASGGGAPARSPQVDVTGQVWKMSEADVQALIREKGYLAASQEIRARYRQDLKGVRISLRK